MLADHDPTAAEAPSGAGSRRLADAMAVGFLAVGAEGRLLDCNASAERLFRRSREDLIGHPYWEVTGLGRKTSFGALVHKVAAKQVAEDAEIVIRNERGSRLVALHVFPAGDRVEVEWSDITAARTAELRLALGEARYDAVANGMPAAAWVSRADGALIYINQALVEALGRRRLELLGHGWIDAIDPEDRDEFLAVRAAARADHSSVRYEGRFRRPDGSQRTIQLYGRPRFDFLGEFCGHVGLAKDVTDIRQSEERQAALINELNHRVKNTLATVQSLVRHTLREHGVARDAERAVVDRVIALSAAHNVLNRESWTGADLGELVHELLSPHGLPDRIAASGPKVRVSPKSAIALAMGLYELATRAAAQGALSASDGRVQLEWNVEKDRVALEWREAGGPPVSDAAMSGFGASFLGRMLTADLGEPAEFTRSPGGLACRLTAPIAAQGRAAA